MEGSVFIMTGNTVIFVTDKRQGNLAAYLPGKVRLLDWRRGFEMKEAHKILEGSRQVILPVPVAKIERNHDVNKFLKEELTKEKMKGQKVFGGVFSPEWKQQFEDYGRSHSGGNLKVQRIFDTRTENYCCRLWKMRKGNCKPPGGDGCKGDGTCKNRGSQTVCKGGRTRGS